ncbi:MAG TPA: hypothetical protein VHO24_15055 [Opitutaceae bacterium]|nr:hypothetical protein [Opitutaceae bacterium]
MKTFSRVLACLLPVANLLAANSAPAPGAGAVPVPVPAATAAATAAPKSKILRSGDNVFSLLPKSFQRNPILDMTVNTEMTEYGRLLRPATVAQPVYYIAQPAGFRQFGVPTAGEKPPPAQELETAMTRALAETGYLQASQPGPSPSLVVIYYWGTHNKLDPETAKDFPELAAKYQLERAVLVGGKKYAHQLGQIMEFGETLFDRTQEKEYLRDQALGDLYFVVASAYDYAAVTQGQKKLVWRTTMTVSTGGVSLRETLGPLIATAAPYFGRESTKPEIVARRVAREVRVEVGIPTVVEEKKTKP